MAFSGSLDEEDDEEEEEEESKVELDSFSDEEKDVESSFLSEPSVFTVLFSVLVVELSGFAYAFLEQPTSPPRVIRDMIAMRFLLLFII